MSIQPDLQVVRMEGSSHLVGLAEQGKEADGIKSRLGVLANHVIQFIFHDITWFLVAHYLTSQTNGPQIYSIFWHVVKALEGLGSVSFIPA